ncbi:MAG TPA: response regulator transcription factor [Thermoanaerobaculia bacterium]|jgi:DNA-binding NarL/FixJ family response regulator|nr:response regulator transcription factor [Thermoanaerobaculia bacterium]
MSRPRVLVADDHTIVRQGLVGILKASGEIDVVGEAADGHEAVEKALETRPDVVILDVSMPRLNGIEAARRIRKALPETRILVLTMHDDDEYVHKMVSAGASGYLLKDGAAWELVTAIQTLHAGKEYFAAQARKALNGFAPSASDDPIARLTDREREIFQLLTEGKRNAEIATLLGISPKTVDNHRTRLMEKIGVHSVSELLRFAARRGLLL